MYLDNQENEAAEAQFQVILGDVAWFADEVIRNLKKAKALPSVIA